MQMARSKFPGKPSKPVKRRRIIVLRTGNTETEASPSECFQEDYQGKRPNLQPSGRCIQQKCAVKVKRKACKVSMDRPLVTKRRIPNSAHPKTRSTKQNSRSEKPLSNRKTNVEPSNLVGKFVLPSRSAHSSRVIKPNKRFLNVDAVTNSQLRTVIKRPIYKIKNPEVKKDISEEMLESKNEEFQNSDRRIILRQARLQLDTQRGKSLEGPFSSNFHGNGTTQPGTVTCGVCGAVRFYRFVNQARKFNIYSCESCRKFISKMIKRQRCNKNSVLSCLKGETSCHIPQAVRCQLWKNRCNYKARCNACWLRMCLLSFQMPQALKVSLTEALPEFMRDTNTVFNSSSLFSFHTTNPNLNATPPNLPSDFSASVPQRVLRRKAEKDLEKSNSVCPPNEIKRQKIDLKGPRVKHVCRSASVVLGQAVAIFSENSEKAAEVVEVPKPEDVCSSAVIESKNVPLKDENCSKSVKSKGTAIETNGDVGAVVSKSTILKVETSSFVSKRDRDKCKPLNIPQISYAPEIKMIKKPLPPPSGICCDFWENYDLDEVSQSGFGLMASTSFPMLAICFLCGSAGRDPLLYCCSCCEPYHAFCLEQAPYNVNPSNQYYNWLCPRCIRCTACGEISKQITNCQKCHNPYHPKCITTEWQSDTKQTICSACIRCKGCGITKNTKFIGNTLLCINCFKLKNKGNFCPLCHECYEENDYDIKMMECGKCNMWVHAKCEGLTDEQYQVLSTLPDSIEFLCCICEPLPYWRKAVDIELRACFNKIIKLLSKNKVARSTLKWNPINFKSPFKSTTMRKLSFAELDNNHISDLGNKDQPSIDLEEFVIKSSITSIEEDISENDDHIMKSPTSPSLTSIKNKINCQEFLTLCEFNINMEEVIVNTKSTELSSIYYSILKEIVPWFDPLAAVPATEEASLCDTSLIIDAATPEVLNAKYKMINNTEIDSRICVLCKNIGDGLSYKEERLLYCGNNEWVHANCAIWSSEVYEEIDGSLQNVQAAINRGRSMSCTHCKIKGASIGCCSRTCPEVYHFSCAIYKQCHFMHDKSFYCHAHYVPGEVSRLLSPSEFVLPRSIYVELDPKKKRYTEPNEVQFMVGSLTISCLGAILPQLSDNAEALIPLNFSCRRMYWSTTEPWKLVPYVITTTTLSNETPTKIVERNFTIDHSLPNLVLCEKLKEISLWQNEVDFEVEYEIDDEEPQNENAPDLLSPELTDAILEELPHGVLDRISMQDIFPKLMGSEELLTADFKLTDLSNTDAICINDVPKKLPLIEDETAALNNKRMNSNKINLNRQRCSITVSCKVDNSLTATSKSKAKNKNLYLSLVQVDGAYDNSSSDCESTMQDVEDLYTPQLSDKPVKCQRCQCTYRTEASYTRHLETCDTLSTSDSDSEFILESEQTDSAIYMPSANSTESMETISVVQSNPEEPYVVSSFESYTSFQTAQNEVHSSTVNTQTFVSSESTEVLPVSQSEIFYSNFQSDLETKPDMLYTNTSSINANTFPILNHPLNCESSQVTIGRAQTLTFNQQSTNQVFNQQSTNQVLNHNSLYIGQPNCSQPGTISLVQPASVPMNHTQTISLNATAPLHISQPIEIQQAQRLTIQSVPIHQEVNPIISIAPPNQITLGTKILQNHMVSVPQNQLVKSAQKILRPRGHPRSLAVKRAAPPTVYIPQANSNGASLVIHQLPSSNMIPAFLESVQQQTGQNLQFVASISPQVAPVVNQSHIMQFQSENGMVNLLPSVQPTVLLPQPQVLNEQIIMDNSNPLMWSSHPLQTLQPILYGFETIVQNTVLQSQQFLPTTVPGILTSNSSFSTTTQVFQTSKLEPVLDVTTGNYVLVNSNSAINSQALPVSQAMVTQIPPTTNVISESKKMINNIYVQANVETSLPNENLKTVTHVSTTINSSENSNETSNPIINRNSIINEQMKSNSANNSNTHTSINASSINLPVTPFLQETGIPTNIVNPTPKSSLVAAQKRPMNRVLPMPTKLSKILIHKNIIKNGIEKPPIKLKNGEKLLDTLIEDLVKPRIKPADNLSSIKVLSNYQVPNESESDKATAKNFLESIKSTLLSEADAIKSLKAKNILVINNLPNNKNLNEKCEKDKNLNESKEVLAKSAISSINIANLRNKCKKLLERDISVPKESFSSKGEIIIVKEPTINEKMPTLTEKSKNSTSLKIVHSKNKTPNLYEKWTKLKHRGPYLNEKNVKMPLKKTNLGKRISEKSVNSNEKNGANLKEQNGNLNSNGKQSLKNSQEKNENKLLYSVETIDGFQYSSTSLDDVWSKVYESVQTARARHNMQPLPNVSLNMMNGLQLMGLRNNGIKYLLEQLPEASKCANYKPTFEFKKQEEKPDEEELRLDISQGSRSVQHTRSHEPSDMFGWLASKYRKPIWDYYAQKEENTRRGGVITNLPMAMKFRNLKLTSKHSVGVYRSKIHRRGLFCHYEIECGDMVIEYAGEVIRSILADKREKQYITKGMGCYMFRIDENFVVDATMKGNAARFINHSCEPNCYSKVIEVLGHKHIVIFALRRIGRGEELTYDYKFPFEEDKIPCTCGTRRCRKFLN